MTIKIDYRMEFERSKKVVAVQGVFGETGTVIILDKRQKKQYTKDFNRLGDALNEYSDILDELVAREDKADRVAEIIRLCKGVESCCTR